MNNLVKCYIYTRVSTAMQVDGFSLEAQKDKLRKYAALNDMEIVGEYSDAGFSGKNIKGRTDFQRMLNDVAAQADAVSYVLVFKLSRFGRNAADVRSSLQLMESQMDTLDLDDPHYDRKMRDLQRRYDEKYDEIAELELQIEEVRNKLRNIRREVVTSDNIYKILLAFDEVYAYSTEAEKRSSCRQCLKKLRFTQKRGRMGAGCVV